MLARNVLTEEEKKIENKREGGKKSQPGNGAESVNTPAFSEPSLATARVEFK